MVYINKNKKDMETEIFPTNSMVPKGETLETFFYKSEWKEGIPPSLIQPTLFLKLCPMQ